jgi:hypothetical protein
MAFTLDNDEEVINVHTVKTLPASKADADHFEGVEVNDFRAGIHLLRDRGRKIVNIREFGATGDGSDQTTALRALQAHLVAHDGCELHVPGGVYAGVNDWLYGVRNVRVIGSGAKFRSLAPMVADRDTLALDVNGDVFTEGGGYLAVHQFNSAAAGSPSVTLSTAADASNYQAGDDVLLYGYVMYPGGWPPSARYHEIAKVASANASTGALSFVRPIRYGYDSRWHEAGTTPGVGAPRVLRLSRRAAFTFAEDIYIEGVEFLKGAQEPSYFAPYDRGGVYARNARYITLARCKAGHLNVSVVERFRAVDCEFDIVEVDKLVGSATFQGGAALALTGGTGADNVIVRDCDILERLGIDTTSVLVDNCNLYGEDPNDFALINAQGVSVTLTNNKVWRRAGDETRLIHGGQEPIAMTVLSATAGSITVAVNGATLEPFISLRQGAKLYTTTTPRNDGIVSAIYSDGTNAVVEANFRTTPNAADVFYVSRTRQLFASGNMDADGNEIVLPQQVNGARRPEVLRVDVDQGVGRTGRMILALPRATGNHAVQVPGILTKVSAVVEDTLADANLTVYPSGGVFWSLGVNGGIAGLREFDWNGARGNQSGDSSTALSQQFVIYDQINYEWGGSGGGGPTFPRGVLILDYLRFN